MGRRRQALQNHFSFCVSLDMEAISLLDRKDPRGIDLLKRACLKGDTASCLRLGNTLHEPVWAERAGVAALNHAEAAKYYFAACIVDDPRHFDDFDITAVGGADGSEKGLACRLLSEMYSIGQGVPEIRSEPTT